MRRLHQASITPLAVHAGLWVSALPSSALDVQAVALIHSFCGQACGTAGSNYLRIREVANPLRATLPKAVSESDTPSPSAATQAAMGHTCCASGELESPHNACNERGSYLEVICPSQAHGWWSLAPHNTFRVASAIELENPLLILRKV